MGPRGVSASDEDLKLMGQELLPKLRRPTGPVSKSALRKTLVRHPEPLSVVVQKPNGVPALAPEDEDAAGHRICLQNVLADSAEPVDLAAEVLRLHRHQDPRPRAD